MSGRIRTEVGRLASLGFQRRYCVHGTASEHLLPEEIVESAANSVRTVLSSPILSKNLTDQQKESLHEFLDCVNTLTPQARYNNDVNCVRELIENDVIWLGLRRAAQMCLNKLGWEASLDELLED